MLLTTNASLELALGWATRYVIPLKCHTCSVLKRWCWVKN